MMPPSHAGRFRSTPFAPGIVSTILRMGPLLLPLALFLPGLFAFPYPSQQSEFSDLVVAHYPYAFYIRQALLQGQGLPTWSPLILSGAPLAANPLASMWYPPAWLALIFTLPLGFNLAIMLHVLWGGIGMYLFLRVEKISPRAAMLGALAFEAMPKLFAHYGAGHLTLLYALSWTPWLLWSAARQETRGFGLRIKWMPALIMALLFLADPRWAVYAALMWFGYTLAHSLRDGRFSPGVMLKKLPALAGQTLVAGLLAAPLGLPLLEYTRLSSRSLMSAEDVLEFSLPASRLLGLLFPDLGGPHEWMLYCGGAILLLSLLALFWWTSIPGARFWAWTAGLALLYSLGSTTPLAPALTRLPGFNLLRVPSRALFIACLALAVMAAYAVDTLLGGVSPKQSRLGGLPLVAVGGFSIALAGGVYALSGRLAMNFLWGCGVILATGIWIGLRLAGRVPSQAWFVGLLGLCLLDWTFVDRSLFAPRPANQVFAEGRQLADYLASKTGIFRVYSPSYSLPQQTSANYNLQLADGVDPLQLQAYVRFMQAASGVPGLGYQVTLPPFANGDPSRDNRTYRPDPRLLGLLNVRFVAAEFDLHVDGLVLRDRFGETRLYENEQAMPRAWIQPQDRPVGQDARLVEFIRWSPERIELSAQGPGLLVLSEVAYPGWSARVDGSPARLELVANLLRGTRLTPGEHEVVFFYRPSSLYAGLILCFITFIFIIFGAQVGRKKAPLSARMHQEQIVSQEAPGILEETSNS